MPDGDRPHPPEATRGPHDDFFCHKYQVWYRLEDCVYRGVNRTYAGCVGCFQGHVNIRSWEAAGRTLPQERERPCRPAAQGPPARTGRP
jgi:hypothetical protein